MKKLTIFLLLLFAANTLPAQFGEATPADIKKTKKLPLIVITEVPWDRQVKKLKKKPADLDRYQQTIDQYNKDFREAVKAWWPYTDKVEFMTWEEAEKMRRQKGTAFAVLYCSRYSLDSNDNFLSANGMKWNVEYDERPLEEIYYGIHIRMRLQFLDDFGKYDPLMEVNLPNRFPGPLELSFGLNAIQLGMEHIAEGKKWGELLPPVEESGKQLSGYTLLIQPLKPKDGKYLNVVHKKFKEGYPFDLQEANAEEMAAAVVAREPSKAYFVLTPVSGMVSTFTSWIVDVESGKILTSADVKSSEKEKDVLGPLIDILFMLTDLK